MIIGMQRRTCRCMTSPKAKLLLHMKKSCNYKLKCNEVIEIITIMLFHNNEANIVQYCIHVLVYLTFVYYLIIAARPKIKSSRSKANRRDIDCLYNMDVQIYHHLRVDFQTLVPFTSDASAHARQHKFFKVLSLTGL